MALVEIPLEYFDQFPGDLSGLKPEQVRQVFPYPSLIELEGRKKDPLFISFLLHGNETTSFYVLQKLQKYIESNPLPRDLILLVGNVYATEQQRRFVEGQNDYNRVWGPGESQEHHLAHRVINSVRERENLFAVVDIHNNTGANPFYACINELQDEHICLGSLFSKTLVYFKNPGTALSVCFSKWVPSVTLECGPSGQQEGVEKAFQFLLDLMNLDSLDHPTRLQDAQIYQTVGRIELKNIVDYDFGFGEEEATLGFAADFEKKNFGCFQEGEVFATYQGHEPPFHVYDELGQDLFDDFFIIINNEIRLKQSVIPSMFTTNKEVIRQDCLGYIMKTVR